MNRILLIEDDALLGEGLTTFLEYHQFSCTWLKEITSVPTHWYQADLVILDRQLKEGDSLSQLPNWLQLKAVPVIILTAKTEVGQRIEGLMAGARDYVTKPFSQQELLARIIAHLRPLGSSQITYANIQIDLSQRTVTCQNEIIELKPKEYQLLLLLIQQQGRVFHREELLNKIWGYQAFPTTRTVDNHILRIRQKLPVLQIETLRGVGYRLIEEKNES